MRRRLRRLAADARRFTHRAQAILVAGICGGLSMEECESVYLLVTRKVRTCAHAHALTHMLMDAEQSITTNQTSKPTADHRSKL